jgi:hypothetical protein
VAVDVRAQLAGGPRDGVGVARGARVVGGDRRRQAREQVREAGSDDGREELAALVLAEALGAAQPVAVEQRRGAARPADRQAAVQVQLDEPVADAQDAELLELRRRVQRGRGLDLVCVGQDYDPAGSSAESISSSAVESTSASGGVAWSKPAAR